ncbi:DUF4272 domain-containing protein [Peribacillus sp. SCS-37]|uniref:DUF4272 domain-containing protein n=1 Tax=Paraperibacillus esterisolvens TaxID=3115296 RepID=UPI0039065CD9
MIFFTDSNMRRKRKSEKLLRSLGIKVNKYLPFLESDYEMRTIEEIALRAMCLCICAAKGEGVEKEVVEGLIKRYDIERHLSPEERAFMVDPNPSENDRIQFTWRYEGYWVLLWGLGYTELGDPDSICDVAFAVTQLSERSAEQFMGEAVLRPKKEIDDQADLILRLHWAVRDVQINGGEIPGGLNPGVVLERHHALNWLIRTQEKWDDITADT